MIFRCNVKLNNPMKVNILITFIFSISFFSPLDKCLGAIAHSNASFESISTMSKREIRKEKKQKKRIHKIDKWLLKHKDTVERFKRETGISDTYLRWTLLSLAAAIGLALLSIFAGFLLFFAAVAAVVAGVFFVLWLLEYA